MRVKDYPVNERHGRVITFASGEYIQCEQGVEAVGLVWTSALPFATVLSKMLTLTKGKVRFTNGFAVISDDELIEGSYSHTLAAVDQRPQDVSFFRLESDNFAFSWRSDIGRIDIGQIRVHECSVVTSVLDDNLNSSLVHELATEGLGAGEIDVLANFEELVSTYPHEALTAARERPDGESSR
ncbi:hypothetical protein [Arthrobacter sp. NicSoilC5]|uniref:hypothetical protein n=1 Tax=Arthrobacter sp. NicSoilC5 TaxID=2831000 RepID=UPI001CC47D0A|nr:hypothetical protein [Arthrobacter sp. NicSoilC5]BCW78874.1 hypothetical protein NicSoilC5_08930 [Arthrobacter sp. NicSoilC5]